MTKALFTALCALALLHGPAASEAFPPEATYLFFVNGAPAGQIAITSATVEGKTVFTSEFKLHVGEERLGLSCRTEYDPRTLRPQFFHYEGDRNGQSMSGTLTLDPDSIRAVQEVAGRPARKRQPWTEGTAIFQNYVIEHLVVLARRLAESGKVYERFALLFPTEMMSTPALAVVESELELPVRSASVVCKKFALGLQNSFPFYLYVESKRNSLIYIDFPANQTEVFLQSAFGDQPKTKYTAPRQDEPRE